MKYNYDKDQIVIVDEDTGPIEYIRSVIKTGKQEDPFFVFDAQEVINKCLEWKKKMPRVTPFYAFKCNNNELLIRVLSSFGVGFDCGAKDEIKAVLSAGVDGSRIIYANPIKQTSHAKYAVDNGVQLTTFDNEFELHKMKNSFPSAKLLLRFRCDASVSRHRLGKKFGTEDNESLELLRLAHKLNVDIAGVCFHVGSDCREAEAFKRGIAIADSLFKLGDSIGLNMKILDIGGGFPGIKGSSIHEMAEIINEALDEYFPPERNVNIMAEPGRYFTASAFTLATQIFSKRMVIDPVTNSLTHMYYINDGIYGSFNQLRSYPSTLYPTPLVDGKLRRIVSSSVWGPTCNARDRVIENVQYPDLNVGEWIIFENMGAYTTAGASTFNGFPITKTVAILKTSSKLQLKSILDWIEEQIA